MSKFHPQQVYVSFPNFRWATQNYTDKILTQVEEEINKAVSATQNEVLSVIEINEIKTRLEKSAKKVIRQNFTLELYGSYQTGLCLSTSDLDLCINVEFDDSINDEWQLANQKKTLLHHLANHFENEPGVQVKNNIPSAKMPLLKINVDFNGLPIAVDITIAWKKSTVDIHSGIQAAKLVQSYTKSFPALKPMAIILKQFFIDWKLHDTHQGYPGSYCIILMIVTFLQYAYSAYSAYDVMRQPKLGGLLIDFLNFYGYHFDFLEMGIRYSFEEKIHYLAYIDGKQKLSMRNPLKPNLVIDDPIVKENNVGSNVSKFLNVKNAFRHALSRFDYLVRKPFEVKSLLEAFLTKDLQSIYPQQVSPSYMQVQRRYVDPYAGGWNLLIHQGHYIPYFIHPESDRQFRQVISTGNNYY